MTRAIVLAAGHGRRMGRPKALLVVSGKPLLLGHVERALEAGCDDVIVVARAEIARRLLPVLEAPARIVVSGELEQAGSLAIGVRALGAMDPDEHVIMTPVDAAPAAVATFALLFGALGGGAMAATPAHRGRGGHPVACRAAVLAPYLERAPPPLRDVLRSLGHTRHRIEVNDPAIAIDLDCVEDVIAWTGKPPAFWGDSLEG